MPCLRDLPESYFQGFAARTQHQVVRYLLKEELTEAEIYRKAADHYAALARQKGLDRRAVKALGPRSRRAVADILEEFAALGIRPGGDPNQTADTRSVLRLVRRIVGRINDADADADAADAARIRVFRPE